MKRVCVSVSALLPIWLLIIEIIASVLRTSLTDFVTFPTDFSLRFVIEVLAQDCSNFSTLAMELLQSFAKPSICGLSVLKTMLKRELTH